MPIFYLAHTGGSTPQVESKLPPDVPIIRLRASTRSLLDGGLPSPIRHGQDRTPPDMPNGIGTSPRASYRKSLSRP